MGTVVIYLFLLVSPVDICQCASIVGGTFCLFCLLSFFRFRVSPSCVAGFGVTWSEAGRRVMVKLVVRSYKCPRDYFGVEKICHLLEMPRFTFLKWKMITVQVIKGAVDLILSDSVLNWKKVSNDLWLLIYIPFQVFKIVQLFMNLTGLCNIWGKNCSVDYVRVVSLHLQYFLFFFSVADFQRRFFVWLFFFCFVFSEQ